jgi:hypothetical protein
MLPHSCVAAERAVIVLRFSAPLHPGTQHTSAYVSIRQHTSAYVSIRQHTALLSASAPRHAVYLLYWYKSTNSDAAGTQHARPPSGSRSAATCSWRLCTTRRRNRSFSGSWIRRRPTKSAAFASTLISSAARVVNPSSRDRCEKK